MESPRTAPESFGGTIFDDRGAQNEFFQHREAEMAYGTNPADSLPSPVVLESPSVTQASAHHPENLVCMVDKRVFVIRDRGGKECARFKPSEVEPRDGKPCVPVRLAYERLSENSGVTMLSLINTLRKTILAGDGTLLMPVAPIRPQCAHYARQKTDMNASKDVRMLSRVCMAQHSETGEYFSLMDSAVYACELRSPRDPLSETQLDEWDDKLIEAEERRRNETHFDVEAELKKGTNGKS